MIVTMSAKLTGLVLGTPAPPALADFYRELLGWSEVSRDPEWARIRAENSEVPGLSFQLEKDHVPPVWPARPGEQHMQAQFEPCFLLLEVHRFAALDQPGGPCRRRRLGCSTRSLARSSRASAAPAIRDSADSGPSALRSSGGCAWRSAARVFLISSGFPLTGSARWEAASAIRARSTAGRVTRACCSTGTPSLPIAPMAWNTGMRSSGRGSEVERFSA